MTTVSSTKGKKPRVLTQVTTGPGIHLFLEIIDQMTAGVEKLTIPEFGNGYRAYPIRFTSIQFVGLGRDLIVNIEGAWDLRDHPPTKAPENVVRIEGYSPYSRKAKRAIIFD